MDNSIFFAIFAELSGLFALEATNRQLLKFLIVL